MKNLHKEFVQLGRERNRITYKLVALLPKIDEQKIYEQEGYADIYAYAAKIAGLSPGVVDKALKLKERLKDMPHLQKAIETQGINKVGIVAGLATKENDKELADKVDNMNKPALQEYSKEKRGKITTKWQIEVDEKMMFMFLKLKKKMGKNLSNKECLRKILEKMQEGSGSHGRSQRQAPRPRQGRDFRRGRQAQEATKIPTATATAIAGSAAGSSTGEKSESPPGWNKQADQRFPTIGRGEEKVTRYISVHQKRNLSDQCSHQNCHRPAEVIHHPDRFSQNPNHENLKPLCKQHHEFAHNGITEPMQYADYQYRKYRQAALL